MVKKYTKDWWSVKDSTGKMGIVPAAYVRHSPEDEDAEETVQERQSKEVSQTGGRNVDDSFGGIV